MKLTHRYTALLVLFAFTTLIPVSAADTVPFHAAIDTTPVPVQVPGCDPPGCIGLEIGGQGTATHMGRIAVAGPSQVVPTSMSGGLQTGESVLTAANGDTLTIAFDGTFDAPQGPFGPVTFAGAWAVVDGSGRFSGATGGGSYSGAATLAAGLGVLLLDGDIARRGTSALNHHRRSASARPSAANEETGGVRHGRVATRMDTRKSLLVGCA